jgi:diguanylate cyclase (GGDEF)-like protein
MDLEHLINMYKISRSSQQSSFNRQIQYMRVPLQEQKDSPLTLVALEGMPIHLTRETLQGYLNDPLMQLLKSEEVVVVPLKAKDKVNGIILADNFVTKKPITKDDLRMLIMLANQAGLAIENSQLYEKTYIQAHLDSLTGVWNHGYFQHLLSLEIENSKASSISTSLIMLDIDDFKLYNDMLGHQFGDGILKELASHLKNQSRKMDYVCRYGGEEFAIILPRTDKKEAFYIAERLREHIEKHPFIKDKRLQLKNLTVSLGLATYPENGNTAAEIIAFSDKTLYQAKKSGKNKTCNS